MSETCQKKIVTNRTTKIKQVLLENNFCYSLYYYCIFVFAIGCYRVTLGNEQQKVTAVWMPGKKYSMRGVKTNFIKHLTDNKINSQRKAPRKNVINELFFKVTLY